MWLTAFCLKFFIFLLALELEREGDCYSVMPVLGIPLVLPFHILDLFTSIDIHRSPLLTIYFYDLGIRIKTRTLLR